VTLGVGLRRHDEGTTRNDTPATATCLAGPGLPCPALFSGADVTFKTQTGGWFAWGSRCLLVRATKAPAVIEASCGSCDRDDLALDILEPHPASPCKTDADCSVLQIPCATDDDCELSHACVNATAGACTTTACRQCMAAVCAALPDSPGQSACGVTIFTCMTWMAA